MIVRHSCKSASLFIAVMSCVGFQAIAKQPNILWVITDDQRPDSLACYNEAVYGKPTSPLGYVESPNIDRLAKEGVLFTNSYCNSPACGPSRGSMHSGRYPFRNGHYSFELTHQKADFVKPMVSQTMMANGYSSAIFGKTGAYIYNQPKKYDSVGLYGLRVHFKHDLQKNDVGDLFATPSYKKVNGKYTSVGSKEVVLYPDGTKKEYALSVKGKHGVITEKDIAMRKKVEEEFDIVRTHNRPLSTLILAGENPKPAGETVDAHIVKEFKKYLANAGKDYKSAWGKKYKGVDADKPVFVNLGFHFPHTPVLPPKSFRDRFHTKDYKVPAFDEKEFSKFPPQLKDWYSKSKTKGMTDREIMASIRDYYAFCAYGDSLVGDAIDSFKEFCEKRNEEYLIVFTVGDHGWHLGEQGGMTKFGPWRQSINNAALVISSDKKKFPAGKVFSGMTEFVDFAPTILAAAGVNVNDSEYDYLDGYDLEQVLTDSSLKRDYIVGEINHVCGPRAYIKTKDFAFSMRTRPSNARPVGKKVMKDIKWALECPPKKADMALYDLNKDPLERNNIAYDKKYEKLAAWFRNKLGSIVLGDGRVECDWAKENSYKVSNFAKGSDDKKINIPQDIIPN